MAGRSSMSCLIESPLEGDPICRLNELLRSGLSVVHLYPWHPERPYKSGCSSLSARCAASCWPSYRFFVCC